MAKHNGRGISTIEYPTGMNQNGDPSQAWIKLKPDGRVDVFAGTVDIGQGSRTVHTQIVADTHRRALRLGDDGQHEHRLFARLHGHVRLARHVHRRQRRPLRGRARARARPRHRLAVARGRRRRPRDRDGEVPSAARPRGRSRSPTSRRGDLGLGELDHRHGRGSQAVRPGRPRDRRRRARSPLRDLLRGVRRRGRGRRRDRRGSRHAPHPGATTWAARSTRPSSRARSRAAP